MDISKANGFEQAFGMEILDNIEIESAYKQSELSAAHSGGKADGLDTVFDLVVGDKKSPFFKKYTHRVVGAFDKVREKFYTEQLITEQKVFDRTVDLEKSRARLKTFNAYLAVNSTEKSITDNTADTHADTPGNNYAIKDAPENTPASKEPHAQDFNAKCHDPRHDTCHDTDHDTRLLQRHRLGKLEGFEKGSKTLLKEATLLECIKASKIINKIFDLEKNTKSDSVENIEQVSIN